jgi:hypothetical protein
LLSGEVSNAHQFDDLFFVLDRDPCAMFSGFHARAQAIRGLRKGKVEETYFRMFSILLFAEGCGAFDKY